ncbi:hypothetical protein [Polycladidibacter stylochi]|uniref:hypothetical protein n=1 Tax=Polycladidibacter stylochi TaxID=1807766 RepID=UPI00082F6F1C|nr:hypothetical protein [Pseudovibrio stylochi]
MKMIKGIKPMCPLKLHCRLLLTFILVLIIYSMQLNVGSAQAIADANYHGKTQERISSITLSGQTDRQIRFFNIRKNSRWQNVYLRFRAVGAKQTSLTIFLDGELIEGIEVLPYKDYAISLGNIEDGFHSISFVASNGNLAPNLRHLNNCLLQDIPFMQLQQVELLADYVSVLPIAISSLPEPLFSLEEDTVLNAMMIMDHKDIPTKEVAIEIAAFLGSFGRTILWSPPGRKVSKRVDFEVELEHRPLLKTPAIISVYPRWNPPGYSLYGETSLSNYQKPARLRITFRDLEALKWAKYAIISEKYRNQLNKPQIFIEREVSEEKARYYRKFESLSDYGMSNIRLSRKQATYLVTAPPGHMFEPYGITNIVFQSRAGLRRGSALDFLINNQMSGSIDLTQITQGEGIANFNVELNTALRNLSLSFDPILISNDDCLPGNAAFLEIKADTSKLGIKPRPMTGIGALPTNLVVRPISYLNDNSVAFATLLTLSGITVKLLAPNSSLDMKLAADKKDATLSITIDPDEFNKLSIQNQSRIHAPLNIQGVFVALTGTGYQIIASDENSLQQLIEQLPSYLPVISDGIELLYFSSSVGFIELDTDKVEAEIFSLTLDLPHYWLLLGSVLFIVIFLAIVVIIRFLVSLRKVRR